VCYFVYIKVYVTGGGAAGSAVDSDSCDEGFSLKKTSCDEGACDEGACDEGACDEGARDEGACDEGACDEGAIVELGPIVGTGAIVVNCPGAVDNDSLKISSPCVCVWE